ncbi:MAG: folate-binding protein YgfZ [Magnetococcales bacterium]|nr:folate-binding protein YgfZ [Magnetococcales bacterium]
MSLLKSHLSQSITWILDDGKEVPAQFSDVGKELKQLTNQAALLDFSHLDQVEISGPERVNFLQGLTTNQIKDVTTSRSIYANMLTPQGRFAWDFTVSDTGETLILTTEPQQGANLVKSLNFYLMRTKAVIKDVSKDFGNIAIVGPEAADMVDKLFPGSATAGTSLGATFKIDEEQLLWRDPRHEDFGWRLQVKSEKYLEIWEKLANIIPPVGQIAWENYRINKGLPRGGKELIPNKTLPLEAGVLEMNGVSFQKGCFVGQETTARTHHRGTLKKRLFQVTLEGDGPVSAETPILTHSEKEAGIITSAICQDGDCHGLALLRLSDVDDNSQLTVDGRKVSVQKPSWASWDLT